LASSSLTVNDPATMAEAATVRGAKCGRRPLAIIALTVLLGFAQPAIGAGGEDGEKPGPPFSNFETLTDQFFPTTMVHLSDRLSFSKYVDWKRRLSSRRGIDYILLNTPIFQVGSEDGETYLDNEMDLYFHWRLIENDRTTGKIYFWGVWVQTFSDLPSIAFARSQGLVTFPNGGRTDPNKSFVAPSSLWWEQTFERIGVTYRVGQLFAPALWGANKYLGDDRSTFMNTAFSTDQGAPWSSASRGLGAMARVGVRSFYAALGFQDSKADPTRIDFSSFGDAHFVYLGEVGFTSNFVGKSPGNYKLNFGYVDGQDSGSAPDQRSGWGVIVSATQDIKEDYGLFAIYRHSWDRYVDNIEAAATAGFVWKKPLGWVDDRLGIGGLWAKPRNTGAEAQRNEFGIEAFWRLQLTHRLDLTPDLQLYLQPGASDRDDPVVVLGLRLRYVL